MVCNQYTTWRLALPCIIDLLNAKLKNKKSFGALRGVSPTIGKGLCVVNFLTTSDSGTRDYTVYVVALLVME